MNVSLLFIIRLCKVPQSVLRYTICTTTFIYSIILLYDCTKGCSCWLNFHLGNATFLILMFQVVGFNILLTVNFSTIDRLVKYIKSLRCCRWVDLLLSSCLVVKKKKLQNLYKLHPWNAKIHCDYFIYFVPYDQAFGIASNTRFNEITRILWFDGFTCGFIIDKKNSGSML